MKTFWNLGRGDLGLALAFFVALALSAALPVRAQEVTLPLSRYEELRARANPEAVPAPGESPRPQ